MADDMVLEVVGQNPIKYEPTETEQKLLEVLLNPEHRTKSITDICKLVGCSRNVYYEAFKKLEFTAIYEQKSKELVKRSIGPVINTFVREALRGSFQHGKVILEMAGLYSEKSQVEISGDISITAMTAEQRRARIAELLAKKEQVEKVETVEQPEKE